jgi:hypothetical protein
MVQHIGKGKSEELALQPRNKVLSNNDCHKHNHYASQCLDKRVKGK